MRNIMFFIESSNGHDEKLVPEENAQSEIEQNLLKGDWAAIKTATETKLVTPPVGNSQDDWKKAFASIPPKESIQQVSVTKPMKGA